MIQIASVTPASYQDESLPTRAIRRMTGTEAAPDMIRNTSSSWGSLARAFHWILGITIGLSLLLMAFGILGRLTIESFVLTVLAPAAPIVIWGLREYYRQRDAADRRRQDRCRPHCRGDQS